MSELDLDAIEARARGDRNEPMFRGYPATALALVAEVRRLRAELAEARRITFNHELTPEELERIRQDWHTHYGTGGAGAVQCTAIVERYGPSIGQRCKRMTRNSSGLCEKHRPSRSE
jgi:hypothetical protein